MRRKNITWKPGNSPIDAVLKPKYLEDRSFRNIAQSEREFYDRHLHVGSLWIIKNNIYIHSSPTKVISHPIPYAGRMMSWSDRQIRQGTLAIYTGFTRVEERDYTGFTRVEERDSRGTLICPLRHTFIVDGTQIMTLELDNFFHPAEI